MNSTQIIAVCVIAVLAVGGVSAVVVMNNNNSSKDSTNNTTDLTWEQIVDDAKGQTITMGFYTSDPMVAVWYEDFVTYMKDT